MVKEKEINRALEEITEALGELSSEERRKQIRYFAPGIREVLGVSNPDLKAVAV